MRKTILILLTLLLTLSISTVALAEEPIITPEFEQKIILSAVENVPADLTLILTLNSEIVGVVQDGQVVNAVPILEQFKQNVKLSIQGEGRLVGARMIFTEEELIEEPEIVESTEPVEEENIVEEDNEITDPEATEPIEPEEPEITKPEQIEEVIETQEPITDEEFTEPEVTEDREEV